MCLLLKFVEKNGREPGSSSDRDLLHEIKQWSVRQQGFYHSHEVDRREDKNVTILISPSADFWGAIKREFGAAHHRRSWGAVPMLAFESLTANWNDYVACLHRAVQNFVRQCCIIARVVGTLTGRKEDRCSCHRPCPSKCGRYQPEEPKYGPGDHG